MGRVLTAKDKAFQREKERLKKQAETYRQLVIARDDQLYEKEKKIAELEQKIAILNEQIEKHFKMTPEEFAEHINKDMRSIEVLEFLMKLKGE